MSTNHIPAPSPIALQPGQGETLWFHGHPGHHQGLNRRTAGRVAVIQHPRPKDAGSPLHVHHRENEWFYVLEGELTIWVDGQVIRAPAGSFVFGPQTRRAPSRSAQKATPASCIAALVWNSDLPRPLQQILFDTAAGVTPPPASSPPAAARPGHHHAAEPVSEPAPALAGCRN